MNPIRTALKGVMVGLLMGALTVGLIRYAGVAVGLAFAVGVSAGAWGIYMITPAAGEPRRHLRRGRSRSEVDLMRALRGLGATAEEAETLTNEAHHLRPAAAPDVLLRTALEIRGSHKGGPVQ